MAHFRIVIGHGTYQRKMRCLRFFEEETQFRLTFAPSKLAKLFVVPEIFCRLKPDGLLWESGIVVNNKDMLAFDTNPPFITFALEMSERAFGFETLRRNASEDSLCSVSSSMMSVSSSSSSVSSASSPPPLTTTPIPAKVVLQRPNVSFEQQHQSTGNVHDSWIPMSIIRTPPPASGRRVDGGSAIWSFVRSSYTDADFIDIEGDSGVCPTSGRYGIWQIQRLLFAGKKELAAPLPEDKTYGDSAKVSWMHESVGESSSPRKMLDLDANNEFSEFVNRVGEFRCTKDKMTLQATIETELRDGRMRTKITRIDLVVAKDSPVVGVFVLSNNMLEQERMFANKSQTPRGFTFGTTGGAALIHGCNNKSCSGKLRCSHVRENDNVPRERRHSVGEGAQSEYVLK
jgi:hypothetical protein